MTFEKCLANFIPCKVNPAYELTLRYVKEIQSGYGRLPSQKIVLSTLIRKADRKDQRKVLNTTKLKNCTM